MVNHSNRKIGRVNCVRYRAHVQAKVKTGHAALAQAPSGRTAASGYGGSPDSEVIAGLLDNFNYRPDKSKEILSRYN